MRKFLSHPFQHKVSHLLNSVSTFNFLEMDGREKNIIEYGQGRFKQIVTVLFSRYSFKAGLMHHACTSIFYTFTYQLLFIMTAA